MMHMKNRAASRAPWTGEMPTMPAVLLITTRVVTINRFDYCSVAKGLGIDSVLVDKPTSLDVPLLIKPDLLV